MKKYSLLSLLLVTTMITGCSDSARIAELKSVQPMQIETLAETPNLSVTNQENIIYSQVADRTLLDLSALEKVISETDAKYIDDYIKTLNAYLVGDVPLSTNNKKSTYADYMLLEFQKTPYVWQMKDYSILGVDTATKNIIVDITYDTTSTLKTVQPDSTIIKGDKDYELKMKVRYDRWMEYLAAKYGSSDRYVVNQPEDLSALRAEFESVYGPVEEIIKSQRHLSLSQEISETRTQKTYTGMTDYELEQNGATMVVRHIFEPDYVLGIQQGYTLKHMYLTDYT
ncbi:MAG: hypothetical protein LBM93_00740, partial [Oscillospiraceae bacterium]|nr:hypothetical protein [Oscillospiraceae bacterium]